MALGRRKQERQQDFWIATGGLPRSEGHVGSFSGLRRTTHSVHAASATHDECQNSTGRETRQKPTLFGTPPVEWQDSNANPFPHGFLR